MKGGLKSAICVFGLELGFFLLFFKGDNCISLAFDDDFYVQVF